jgi:DNA end-binding protein Ku
MAKQLIAEMSGKWDPEDFKDEFRHQVMKLVEKKAKAGKTETVVEPEEEAPQESSNVIDLTELLQRSLKGGSKANGKAASKSAGKTAPAKKAKAKRATAKKSTPERKAA